MLGPIPARTGQPCVSPRTGSHRGAYPRSHGATGVMPVTPLTATGLSPLARGNRLIDKSPLYPLGPIPARTGQPLLVRVIRGGGGAYPRSHGATVCQVNPHGRCQGLSPLARGNHHHAGQPRWLPGPIPARTGQPGLGAPDSCSSWAYPRSHGATVAESAGVFPIQGLSPLARGNLGQGID